MLAFQNTQSACISKCAIDWTKCATTAKHNDIGLKEIAEEMQEQRKLEAMNLAENSKDNVNVIQLRAPKFK